MGALSLTDQQLSRLLRDSDGTIRDLDRIECEPSLSTYIKRAWSQIEPAAPYKHGWHMDAICEHLQAVSYGYLTRLLINVPPGTSKSLSTAVFFPSWEWGPRGLPHLRYIGTSYSERYALRDSARTRNLIQSQWYQDRWGDHVQLTREGDKKIENTEFGFREAIPFKSLTAGRADRLIIDDPHSTESAESDTERDTTIRVFLESVPTRLNDPEKSAIIIIMQRLHQEDVSGVALAKDLGYTHLMLPMEYDPSRHCVTYFPNTPDVIFEDPRTKPGQLLFPDRFPKVVLDGYKQSLGTYGYAGQMQQMPVPRGGGIFHYDWWQLWGNPDDSDDPAFKRFPRMEYVVASFDGAYTEKTENDPSALTIWGVFKDDGRLFEAPVYNTTEHPLAGMLGVPPMGRQMQRRIGQRNNVMLMHAWEARLPLNDVVEKVAATCKRYGVQRLLIENKATGISVGQEMRRLHAAEGYAIQLVDPKGIDKVARAYSVQPVFEALMVYAPQREWSDMVKDQMAVFPKSSHDDLTDTATQAIRHLRDVGLLLFDSEIEREVNDELAHKTEVARPLYPV